VRLDNITPPQIFEKAIYAKYKSLFKDTKISAQSSSKLNSPPKDNLQVNKVSSDAFLSTEFSDLQGFYFRRGSLCGALSFEMLGFVPQSRLRPLDSANGKAAMFV
jgi:hypothetical protein